MLEAFRKFLESSAGKAVAAGLVVVGVVFALFAVRNVTTSEAEELARQRMFIDVETGKAFAHELKMGQPIPVRAPSGKQSGYPAEACYWTRDGETKTEPTWVFVSSVWKGGNEATFCPDCQRLVVGHNPVPNPGSSPPPTREEYAKNPRRGASERR